MKIRKVVPNVCCNFSTCCLQADILDVNQIFKDLAMMIHDQGDMIGKCLRTRSFLVVTCFAYVN